jgi:hypothetical protein
MIRTQGDEALIGGEFVSGFFGADVFDTECFNWQSASYNVAVPLCRPHPIGLFHAKPVAR